MTVDQPAGNNEGAEKEVTYSERRRTNTLSIELQKQAEEFRQATRAKAAEHERVREERRQKLNCLKDTIGQYQKDIDSIKASLDTEDDQLKRIMMSNESLIKMAEIDKMKEDQDTLKSEYDANPLTLTAEEETALREYKAMERLKAETMAQREKEQREKEEQQEKYIVDHKTVAERRRKAKDRHSEMEKVRGERKEKEKNIVKIIDDLDKSVESLRQHMAQMAEVSMDKLATLTTISDKLNELESRRKELEDFREYCEQNPLTLTADEESALREQKALEDLKAKIKAQEKENANNTKLHFKVDQKKLADFRKSVKEKYEKLKKWEAEKAERVKNVKGQINAVKSKIVAIDEQLEEDDSNTISTAPSSTGGKGETPPLPGGPSSSIKKHKLTTAEELQLLSEKMPLLQQLDVLDIELQKLTNETGVELSREEEAALRSIKAFESLRSGDSTRRKSDNKLRELAVKAVSERRRSSTRAGRFTKISNEQKFAQLAGATKHKTERSLSNADSDGFRRTSGDFDDEQEFARKILGLVPMFRECADDIEFIDEMAAILTPMMVPGGSLVCEKGDIGKEMYFILHGDLVVMDEHEDIIGTLKDGDFFGEVAVMFNSRRTATIKTVSFCTMLQLNQTDFLTVLNSFPQHLDTITKAAHKRVANFIHSSVANIGFFRDCPPALISDMCHRLDQRKYPAGSTVVQVGELGKEMYFVSMGELRVEDAMGRRLNVLAVGDFFGEIALIHNAKRTATIVAKTDCELFVLNKYNFEVALQDYPEHRGKIMEAAAARIKALQDQQANTNSSKAADMEELTQPGLTSSGKRHQEGPGFVDNRYYENRMRANSSFKGSFRGKPDKPENASVRFDEDISFDNRPYSELGKQGRQSSMSMISTVSEDLKATLETTAGSALSGIGSIVRERHSTKEDPADTVDGVGAAADDKSSKDDKKKKAQANSPYSKPYQRVYKPKKPTPQKRSNSNKNMSINTSSNAVTANHNNNGNGNHNAGGRTPPASLPPTLISEPPSTNKRNSNSRVSTATTATTTTTQGGDSAKPFPPMLGSESHSNPRKSSLAPKRLSNPDGTMRLPDLADNQNSSTRTGRHVSIVGDLAAQPPHTNNNKNSFQRKNSRVVNTTVPTPPRSGVSTPNATPPKFAFPFASMNYDNDEFSVEQPARQEQNYALLAIAVNHQQKRRRSTKVSVKSMMEAVSTLGALQKSMDKPKRASTSSASILSNNVAQQLLLHNNRPGTGSQSRSAASVAPPTPPLSTQNPSLYNTVNGGPVQIAGSLNMQG